MEELKMILEAVKDMGSVGAWLYAAYLVVGLIETLGAVALVFYGINTIIGKVITNGSKDK